MDEKAVIIIRYIGQNIEQVVLDELDGLFDLAVREFQSHLRWLIKNKYVREEKATLRKFRYLHLEPLGLEYFKSDITEIKEKTKCATKPTKQKSGLITGSFR